MLNNTQPKNAKERQIDSILQTLHLVVFQNIDDVENFMGFANELISEKRRIKHGSKRTNPRVHE